MRPCVRVKMLTSGDYKELKKAANSRKLAAGRVRRAKIILLSNQGYTAREIAANLDCNERTALKWIGRFNRYWASPGRADRFALRCSKFAPSILLEVCRTTVVK